MLITIDIPEEFIEDFVRDNFEDSLNRLCADAHLLAGRYEKEVAEMLIGAFKNSISIDKYLAEEEQMIDFAKMTKVKKETDETLNNILSKNYDNFEQYAEVSKITDIEVAKTIIKRLLDKLNRS